MLFSQADFIIFDYCLSDLHLFIFSNKLKMDGRGFSVDVYFVFGVLKF